MNRAPQLEALLRTLKLPGMADMLGERLAQARTGKLGHAELLALLCGDESARRDAAGLARRLAAARFEATYAVEDFDFAYNPDVPAGVIRDLATLRFLDQGESVILHCPAGVGKTMLAQALGQLACRRGHTAAFTNLNQNHFARLLEAKFVIAGWRAEYNTVRPHSALGYQPRTDTRHTAPTNTNSKIPNSQNPWTSTRGPVRFSRLWLSVEADPSPSQLV